MNLETLKAFNKQRNEAKLIYEEAKKGKKKLRKDWQNREYEYFDYVRSLTEFERQLMEKLPKEYRTFRIVE